MAGDEFELDIGTETSKGAAPPLVLKTSSSNSEEPGGFSSSHGSSQEEGVNLDETANDVSMTEQHNSTSENLNNSSQEKTPAGRKNQLSSPVQEVDHEATTHLVLPTGLSKAIKVIFSFRQGDPLAAGATPQAAQAHPH